MENDETQGGGFKPPENMGVAQAPKPKGQVTKTSVTKEAVKATKKVVRNIKVMAIAKGWFDTKRIEPGHKFNVSEDEFSPNWMQKI